MNIAFFCSTPYQILLTLNLTYTYFSEDKVDLFILDHFKDAHQIKENIKKKNVNLFRNVDVVECIEFSKSFSEDNPLLRQARKTKALLRYETIGKKYFDFDKHYYDEVFFTYPDIIIQIALKVLYENNNKLEINMFEDGTGGYSEAIMDSKWTKKIFNKITGTTKVIDYYNNYWMFKPELFEGSVRTKEIKKIPPISTDNQPLIDIINNTFDYNSSNDIKQRVVFFDQPMKKFNKGAFDNILNIVSNEFDNDFIVKLHPRTDWDADKYKKGLSTYTNKKIPWEVLALNSGIEDKILISYFSTALTSNKIIFDAEPILIFLYDLKEFKEINKISEDLVNFSLNLKKTYTDSSRIYIPKNIYELKQIIAEISK